MKKFSIIVFAIGMMFVSISYFIVWGFIMVPSPNSDCLDQKGINGTAVILDSQQTGVYIKKNPQVKLKLEVTIPGKSPYEVNYITVVPYINTPKFQPGDKYNVLVDPNNPQTLKFA